MTAQATPREFWGCPDDHPAQCTVCAGYRDELGRWRVLNEERNTLYASQLSGAHVGRWITFDGRIALLAGVQHRMHGEGKVRLQLNSFDNRHGGLMLVPEDTIITVTDERPRDA